MAQYPEHIFISIHLTHSINVGKGNYCTICDLLKQNVDALFEIERCTQSLQPYKRFICLECMDGGLLQYCTRFINIEKQISKAHILDQEKRKRSDDAKNEHTPPMKQRRHVEETMYHCSRERDAHGRFVKSVQHFLLSETRL